MWARHRYEHLDRRYAIEEIHEHGEMVLVLARVEYVWRDSGDVGDSSPVSILLAFREGKLSRLHVYESWAEGQEALGG